MVPMAEVEKTQVQRGVRAVLAGADKLSRIEHDHALETAAQQLAALRTVLRAIDSDLGRGAAVRESLCDDLHHLVAALRKAEMVEVPRAFYRLLDDAERLELRLRGQRSRVRARRERGSRALWITAAAGAAVIAGAVVATRRR